MASELFNSLSGYSVGIPPIPVIDANGNVVTNVISNGNIIVANVYANQYFWGNGQPLSTAAAGSDTQLQFNNGGQFGGIPNVTWNGTFLNLGDASQLKILGGNNGYFLQTDGTGNLSWAEGGGGGGNGTPGGANTQVQFNDAGTFGGDSGFTYDKLTNTLRVENISAGDSTDDTVNIIGNLAITGNINVSTNLVSNGNITGDFLFGDGGYISNIHTDVANYVSQANQANITALGNLQFLNVDGDMVSLGNIATSGNINAGNISLSSNINAGNGYFVGNVDYIGNLNIQSVGKLRVTGNINTSGSPNINLGTLSNIHIGGGVNGYVLTTDGTGNLSWTMSGGGGGNGEPAGSNTQVQFNNNGLFGASPYFTFNDFTHTVQIGGNLIANSMQMGAGAYKWSMSQVYFASTASIAPQQVLYSIPTNDCSGVEFQIIATEPAGPSRQFCKISALYYNGTVQFNEYASLFVNGGVGNFEVDYNPGDIIIQPSLELKVTPNSSNPITYKMLITVFAP